MNNKLAYIKYLDKTHSIIHSRYSRFAIKREWQKIAQLFPDLIIAVIAVIAVIAAIGVFIYFLGKSRGLYCNFSRIVSV